MNGAGQRERADMILIYRLDARRRIIYIEKYSYENVFSPSSRESFDRNRNRRPDNQVTIEFPWKKNFIFAVRRTRTSLTRIFPSRFESCSESFLQNLGNYTFGARSLSKTWPNFSCCNFPKKILNLSIKREMFDIYDFVGNNIDFFKIDK